MYDDNIIIHYTDFDAEKQMALSFVDNFFAIIPYFGLNKQEHFCTESYPCFFANNMLSSYVLNLGVRIYRKNLQNIIIKEYFLVVTVVLSYI